MRVVAMASLASLVLAGCVSTSWPTAVDTSALADAPDHFLVVEPTTGAKSEPDGSKTCHSPIADPRSGVQFALARSSDGFGDYFPGTAYDLKPDQLLRIDCRTGRPIGATTGLPDSR